MKLDFSSLTKAIQSLDRAVIRSQLTPLDEEVRDAVIQRFEYTYELAWKMLKRKLEQEVPSASVLDQLSFKDLIREGAERGYIDRPEEWFEFREARNQTSHTYNATKATSVHQTAMQFLPIVKKLLIQLERS